MEAQNTPEQVPERKQNPWMLLVYFVAIFVFAQVAGMIFRAMAG